MKVRHPAVAGKFYPADSYQLKKLMKELENEVGVNPDVHSDFSETQIIGGIVPHAAVIYSGRVAIPFFQSIQKLNQKIDTFIVLHPDHYGIGKGSYTDDCDEWMTPLGTMRVDRELARLMNLSFVNTGDNKEHAAEVILPFLQYFFRYKFLILPVGMCDQSTDKSRKLAGMLHSANEVLKRNIMVIASSDFSHYVEPEVGYDLDSMVIDHIVSFDIDGLYSAVIENNISLCGYGPIMTLMSYSQVLNTEPKVKILARGNSGKAGSDDHVVDYVSAVVYT